MDVRPRSERLLSQKAFTWGFWVFAAIAVYFLWTEHRAHLMGALPWLLLLACPLTHHLMHRGHHARHDVDDAPKDSKRDDQAQASHGCH